MRKSSRPHFQEMVPVDINPFGLVKESEQDPPRYSQIASENARNNRKHPPGPSSTMIRVKHVLKKASHKFQSVVIAPSSLVTSKSSRRPHPFGTSSSLDKTTVLGRPKVNWGLQRVVELAKGSSGLTGAPVVNDCTPDCNEFIDSVNNRLLRENDKQDIQEDIKRNESISLPHDSNRSSLLRSRRGTLRPPHPSTSLPPSRPPVIHTNSIQKTFYTDAELQDLAFFTRPFRTIDVLYSLARTPSPLIQSFESVSSYTNMAHALSRSSIFTASLATLPPYSSSSRPSLTQSLSRPSISLRSGMNLSMAMSVPPPTYTSQMMLYRLSTTNVQSTETRPPTATQQDTQATPSEPRNPVPEVERGVEIDMILMKILGDEEFKRSLLAGGFITAREAHPLLFGDSDNSLERLMSQEQRKVAQIQEVDSDAESVDSFASFSYGGATQQKIKAKSSGQTKQKGKRDHRRSRTSWSFSNDVIRHQRLPTPIQGDWPIIDWEEERQHHPNASQRHSTASFASMNGTHHPLRSSHHKPGTLYEFELLLESQKRGIREKKRVLHGLNLAMNTELVSTSGRSRPRSVRSFHVGASKSFPSGRGRCASHTSNASFGAGCVSDVYDSDEDDVSFLQQRGQMEVKADDVPEVLFERVDEEEVPE